MDTELIQYKSNKIKELTATYNNNINITRQQYLRFINYIIQQRISPIYKRALINRLIQEYNRKLQFLRNNFNYNISYINSLTNIPGRRTQPDKFALLVGVNYNNTPYQLQGCINDAHNIQNLLKEKYGYNNFTLLTDDTNSKPTRQNILNQLTNMLRNSIKGDKLFFLFSGHGSYILDKNGDEDDGNDELILPIDLNYILDDEIKSILDRHLKEDVQLFALIDSCHSGTAMDLRYNYLENDNITIINKVNETKGNVFMISGCKDDQTSIDAFITDSSNNSFFSGAMTFSFLKTLEKLQYTNINYKLLIENMRTFLEGSQFTQIPQLSSGKQIDIEKDFINL